MRRQKLEIISDLLEVCIKGSLKTNMVYKTNLNFKIAEVYLNLLLNKKLIMKNGETYITTQKGTGFLKKARALLSEL